MRELFVLLAVIALVPAAFLVFVGRTTRLAFFAIGLAVGFGIQFVMDLGGPDSPALIIPFFGFALSVGAVIAELLMILWSLMTGTSKQRVQFKSHSGYTLKEPRF